MLGWKGAKVSLFKPVICTGFGFKKGDER